MLEFFLVSYVFFLKSRFEYFLSVIPHIVISCFKIKISKKKKKHKQ